MQTSLTLVTIAGAFGIAWLFWKSLEPKYRAAQREGGKAASAES